MHLALFALNKTHPNNVMRLARFMGIVTHNRELDAIIEEVHLQSNYYHLL